MDLGSVAIRDLVAADVGVYRALWLSALTEHAHNFRTALEDDPKPGIPTRFSTDSFTLGAWSGNELYGIVSLDCEPRAKLKHKALLFRMFVHPKTSSAGLGRGLLAATIAKARAATDLQQITLTVLATNVRAQTLYTSMGFEEFARERASVRIGDEFVDELQMVLFLYR
ncbi:MAG TPA: GNAT family N-acetyltransferase [Steroidobacteraceae bacterium]|nr:GNAT family N-acetyltransferase [Steroidobacteraceae bacterium]